MKVYYIKFKTVYKIAYWKDWILIAKISQDVFATGAVDGQIHILNKKALKLSKLDFKISCDVHLIDHLYIYKAKFDLIYFWLSFLIWILLQQTNNILKSGIALQYDYDKIKRYIHGFTKLRLRLMKAHFCS